jgi:hypothetical protein
MEYSYALHLTQLEQSASIISDIEYAVSALA